ncbi:MAG: methyltransferase domain-containing protein [Chthoniobacterales bacterium]|nr:methyltransferase domain-containing protein [Chthoniobacterales bacterium]MCX7712126.1 methyltransferase domain-containing protein [Chthoniobacterales bacterium]
MDRNYYESSELLGQYCLFHYGNVDQTIGEFPVPAEACNYPRRLLERLLQPTIIPSGFSRVLDAGCAVGGISFLLSAYFDEVVGVDVSRSFIDAAKELAAHREHRVKIRVEGNRYVDFVATLPTEARPERVRFLVADVCSLPSELGKFHALVASNLVCRLPQPRRFLKKAAELLCVGGQLLLATPFSWMEEFTSEKEWIGGTEHTGASKEALEVELSKDFIKDKSIEIPFLIREHSRKFQYVVAYGSRWIRKS